jgi:hypothetical protein
MYLLDYNHPTELFNERREALRREARDARLAGELSAATRSKDDGRSKRSRSREFDGRTILLWGRTSVPFFRA